MDKKTKKVEIIYPDKVQEMIEAFYSDKLDKPERGKLKPIKATTEEKKSIFNNVPLPKTALYTTAGQSALF